MTGAMGRTRWASSIPASTPRRSENALITTIAFPVD
jgi:hypothetical protein